MEVYRKLTHSHKHTFSHPHTFAMLIVAAKGMKQTARVEKGAGTPPSPINSKSKASFWVVVVGVSVCNCVLMYKSQEGSLQRAAGGGYVREKSYCLRPRSQSPLLWEPAILQNVFVMKRNSQS